MIGRRKSAYFRKEERREKKWPWKWLAYVGSSSCRGRTMDNLLDCGERRLAVGHCERDGYSGRGIVDLPRVASCRGDGGDGCGNHSRARNDGDGQPRMVQAIGECAVWNSADAVRLAPALHPALGS